MPVRANGAAYHPPLSTVLVVAALTIAREFCEAGR